MTTAEEAAFRQLPDDPEAHRSLFRTLIDQHPDAETISDSERTIMANSLTIAENFKPEDVLAMSYKYEVLSETGGVTGQLASIGCRNRDYLAQNLAAGRVQAEIPLRLHIAQTRFLLDALRPQLEQPANESHQQPTSGHIRISRKLMHAVFTAAHEPANTLTV